MKRIFITMSLITAVMRLQAQELAWEEAPKLHTITNEEFLKSSAVIIDESVIKEFIKGDTKNSPLDTRFKIHKIIRINDEKGVEMYNKVKIAWGALGGPDRLKARTITPSGKVINLVRSNFKQVKDDDGYIVTQFAFEGVEKGCELEYYYEIPLNMNFFGSYTMQDQVPTIYTSYQIISPPYLKFDAKTYGNLEKKENTCNDNVCSIIIEGKNIPAIEKEELAHHKAEMMRLEYKLAYNLNKPGERLFTWNDVAKTIYERYSDYSDKEKKEFAKILRNEKFSMLNNESERIRWIENYVKRNILATESGEEKFSQISDILKLKMANSNGMKKLLVGLYREAGIDLEMGFTTSRVDKKFDYDFDNYDNLDNMLLYFPKTGKYLAPTANVYRYPFIPSSWGEQDALFIKEKKIGSFTNALPEKRYVNLEDYNLSFHNHQIDIAFNNTMDTVYVRTNNMMKGGNSIQFIPLFEYGEKDKLEDAVKEILMMMDKEDVITDVKWDKVTFEDLSNLDTMSLRGTIRSTSILEKAGNKFLLKIGHVIGRQQELYEDKERKFDLDMDHPHKLERDIVFTIPNGYKVKNLSDLKINKVAKLDGQDVCSFISDYKVEGNKVVISIVEIYKKALYPLSIYQDVRSVINAAADFNKVVLVLEKG